MDGFNAQNVMFIKDLLGMEKPPMTVWVADTALTLWVPNSPRKHGYYIHDLSLCAIDKDTWSTPRELMLFYNNIEKKYELYTTETGLPVEVAPTHDGVYFAAFMLFIAFVLGAGTALLIFWKQGKL